VNENSIATGKYVKQIVADLAEEIPQRMREKNIPGLSMALVSREGAIWTGCFGYTDMTKVQEVNVETLFGLQSTTKTVTSVAFLLAVQKGLVKLDDPLVDYYPEFTVNSRFGKDECNKISFRHLLSHSSGLAMEARVGGVFNSDHCTFEEHVQSVSDSWLKFPVGTGFSYSNVGMDVVAYALERITGMRYPEYVQKALGDPLGITFHYDTQKVHAMHNAAKGHLGKRQALPVDPVGLGCGAAHLSIKDQAVFVRFLLNSGAFNGKQMLHSNYVGEMRVSDKEGWYGLGTFIGNDCGAVFCYHPGGGFGLRSELFWVPAYDFGVAAFANQEYQNYLGSLAKRVLRRVLQEKGVSPETTDFPFKDAPSKEVNSRSLEKLEGVYSGTWNTVRIELLGEKLYLVYPRRKVELRPYSATAFGAKSPRGVVFQLDEKGSPVSMKIFSENLGVLHMSYLGRPSKEHGPKREAWSRLIGKYTMIVYGTVHVSIRVQVDLDGYLHLEGWSNERLYEHPSIPDLFFTYQGDAVIFENDYMLYGNTKWRRILSKSH
jgi:CubicO group peptidase (beta-lactamase class C family)